VVSACLLPDRRIASGSNDLTIELRDTKTGREIESLLGHSFPPNALCVLAHGRRASGSIDDTIRLWDTKTSAETAGLLEVVD
jgi:WD40 repeat protein